MVGAKGLGDEARQAQWVPKGHSRRRAQAGGHSAPHVDRPNRVQLVEEGGCRVTSNNETKGFLQYGGIHQRRLTPSCGGQAPTAERTVGPARMIAESLTPKPGIREQNRPEAAVPRCPLL